MPLVLAGATSGSATLQATDAQTVTLTLPASTGTLVVTGGAQTIEFADGSASAPSITNSGDTNTGMFFPAADTIGFAEGGTEAMRLDSSGNVVIGGLNSSGSQKLHITSSGTVGIRLENQSSNYWDITNNSNLIFNRGGTNRMLISSGGSVGIGTNSPVSGLEVFRETSTTGSLTDASLMLSTGATTGRKVSIGFGLGGGVANTCAAVIGYDVTNGSGAGRGNIYFSTRSTTSDTTPSERMRITEAGDIAQTCETLGGAYIRAQSSISVANNSTVSITSGEAGSVIVCVYNTGLGNGGVFFGTYTGNMVKLAGDGDATDSGSGIAVYKGVNSHTITFKNRGGTGTFSFGVYSASASR